ncbi:hypothetical protein J2W91_003512 [Paenibacillus amylolyticus]|uniref:Uncharacterized protein n=1 Tax=Paenibacillus amylolyticus TaxID=1451 RepID=A0AAP5H707_PAEAM|nr:hypothetical protein [Paenibacillus amylolyticus]MDR6725026.1 hypothetical protein [Paenibacillus amylolyticus]
MKELYKQDFDNLPPEEKAAWRYDHYYRTRLAIDKYFTSYGLGVAMVIGMMERAKEADIRYVTMINIIDAKLSQPFSSELSEIESLFADLFREVLRPLTEEQKG